MNKRKILIISHNPMSNEDNMGRTIKNIFSKFSKEEICQLYLRNQKPYFEGSNSFYCFQETSILKSIFRKKIKTGKITKISDFDTINVTTENNIVNSIYQFGRKRNQFIYLIRNICWDLGNWFTQDLKDWLNYEQPTCIFFFAGDYSFLFKIVIKIADYLKIPVYSYYVDEYYFTKLENSLIPLEANIYRKNFRKVFDFSQMNFCISEKMKNEYQIEFGKKVELLMNVTLKKNNKILNLQKDNLKMCYLGNLSYKRWENLSEMSTCIEKLNKQFNRKIEFKIYSNEKNKEILEAFTSNKDVHFEGSLNQNEVDEKILDSDILVHTESFNSKIMKKVEYSLSTKIPDSLASGNLFLIYGPSGIEPVDYLKRNQAAFIINSKELLLSKLKELYYDFDYSNIINNAQNLVEKNHTNDKNYELLDYYL